MLWRSTLDAERSLPLNKLQLVIFEDFDHLGTYRLSLSCRGKVIVDHIDLCVQASMPIKC